MTHRAFLTKESLLPFVQRTYDAGNESFLPGDSVGEACESILAMSHEFNQYILDDDGMVIGVIICDDTFNFSGMKGVSVTFFCIDDTQRKGLSYTTLIREFHGLEQKIVRHPEYSFLEIGMTDIGQAGASRIIQRFDLNQKTHDGFVVGFEKYYPGVEGVHCISEKRYQGIIQSDGSNDLLHFFQNFDGAKIHFKNILYRTRRMKMTDDEINEIGNILIDVMYLLQAPDITIWKSHFSEWILSQNTIEQIASSHARIMNEEVIDKQNWQEAQEIYEFMVRGDNQAVLWSDRASIIEYIYSLVKNDTPEDSMDSQIRQYVDELGYKAYQATIGQYNQSNEFIPVLPEKLGSFHHLGEKYTVVELFTDEHCVVEGRNIGNCLLWNKGYIRDIRAGKKRLFSIRDSKGTSRYTLSYRTSNGFVEEFQGGNTQAGSPQVIVDSTMIERVFTLLDRSGLEIRGYSEKFSVSIYKESKLRGKMYHVNEILSIDQLLKTADDVTFIHCPDYYRLRDNLTSEQIQRICKIPGISVTINDLSGAKLSSIEEVGGNLKSNRSLPNLKMVQGAYHFDGEKFLHPELTYLGGDLFAGEDCLSVTALKLGHVDNIDAPKCINLYLDDECNIGGMNAPKITNTNIDLKQFEQSDMG